MVRCPSCAHDNPPGLPRCRNCGAELPASTRPAPHIDDDLAARVRSLTEAGRKIEAIKLFRERTGAGLKEAEDAVEAIERGQAPPASPVGDRAFEDEVATLLERGQKIEAIRRYRERTGVGLKEAKDAVEAIRRGQAVPSGPQSDRDLEDEVATLLERGQQIEAIKRYRERTRVGLKEAKDAVERMAERRGLITSQGAGCLGLALLALISLVWFVGLR
jgi:large subunit ribosomal protein L7/L12